MNEAKGFQVAAKLLGVTSVPEATPFVNKTMNGYDFVVTREGVERAVKECGELAVRRFFADGVDATVNGKKVSEWMNS